MSNNLQKAIVGLLLIILCLIFPFLLIIVIPMGIYFLSKSTTEKKEIDDFIAQELSGKSPKEVENFRLFYIQMANNPTSTEIEKANAEYIVKFIENKYVY